MKELEMIIRQNKLTHLRVSLGREEFIVSVENDTDVHADFGFNLEETINRTIEGLNEKS